MASKFIKLANFFDKQQDIRITLTLNRIEELIGEPLCMSARRHHAYWHPSPTHTITRCWVDNGYRTVHVDLAAEQITFEKA